MIPKILQLDHSAPDPALLENCRSLGLTHVAGPASERLVERCADYGLGALLDIDMDDPDAETRIRHFAAGGAREFRLRNLGAVPRPRLVDAIAGLRADCAILRFVAWTPGMDWRKIRELAGTGIDSGVCSLAWWDRRSAWLIQEYDLLRGIGPVIAFADAMDAQNLRLAAGLSDGLIVAQLSDHLRDASALMNRVAEFSLDGTLRPLTGESAAAAAWLRPAIEGRAALAIVVNSDSAHPAPMPISLAPLPPQSGGAFNSPAPIEDGIETSAALSPGEVRLLKVHAAPPIQGRLDRQIEPSARLARLAIEAVTPSVDSGAFPAKRVVGDVVEIGADIFSDGHDRLAAELLWRAADERDWRRVAMTPLVNDRWVAEFRPERIGRHYFTIEAWVDEFGSFCRELEIKQRAGVNLKLELEEGRAFLDGALAARFDESSHDERIALLLAPLTRRLVGVGRARAFLARFERELAIEVDRPQAAFASWYELFPRSATDHARRHGTFDDVIRLLPEIRAMGFDVLYFPPIHPIGRTNRKGPNNNLAAGPDDPGSPYAIGSEEGGHDAIHPQLGTIGDFRRLRMAAAAHGLELALDFAIQCSPDHPWLKEHPEWFRWRPDGSLRFAENPPKKYEDIVNVDFYARGAVPDLWLALRAIVLFWIAEGVKLFRVDNPHTKPLPFWQWLIESVRAQHPDAIFLSEAFTRPKMMYRLAKIGFGQSYSYFTWRNSKQELTDYLTELTGTEAREFFRPHFFVNTPDINPYFLQSSGRSGFLIRAALAATLSGLWGVYSGFEFCEAAALPGREEYLDSEKYQIRVRDREQPNSIKAEIARLNWIRRSEPALHTHLNLAFYNAFNDQVILYGKAALGRADMILVAVSLDPHRTQIARFEAPLWEWDLPDTGSLDVHDLMNDQRAIWTGKIQEVRLDPAALPFAIWRIAPLGTRRP